jgi:hypothetical protein
VKGEEILDLIYEKRHVKQSLRKESGIYGWPTKGEGVSAMFFCSFVDLLHFCISNTSSSNSISQHAGADRIQRQR